MADFPTRVVKKMHACGQWWELNTVTRTATPCTRAAHRGRLHLNVDRTKEPVAAYRQPDPARPFWGWACTCGEEVILEVPR